MSEAGRIGTFNATGPVSLLTMQHFLQSCKDVTRSDARFTWLSEAFITEQHLEGDFPIWTPSEAVYFATVDCSRAIVDGLTFRPLEDTIQATLQWNASRPEGFTGRAGISREREATLLEEWHAKSGK